MGAFPRMIEDPLTHQPFRCDVEPHREAVRVRPVGELDLATVDVVEARLSDLRAAGFTAMTLDLRGLRFIDSTGLRMILLWDARAREDGFAFRLIAGPPAVQRLFDLTGTTAQLGFVDP
jgi:anti-sigma B factor antagonist